jgi:flagellin FlaB
MNLSLSRTDSQKGITGLETAIIMIAFVAVASVFAFTVLSTGIFASERSKETVFAGIEEAQSSIDLPPQTHPNTTPGRPLSEGHITCEILGGYGV